MGIELNSFFKLFIRRQRLRVNLVFYHLSMLHFEAWCTLAGILLVMYIPLVVGVDKM